MFESLNPWNCNILFFQELIICTVVILKGNCVLLELRAEMFFIGTLPNDVRLTHLWAEETDHLGNICPSP